MSHPDPFDDLVRAIDSGDSYATANAIAELVRAMIAEHRRETCAHVFEISHTSPSSVCKLCGAVR